MPMGSVPAAPAMAASSRPASSDERAIGPTTTWGAQPSPAASNGTRPGVVRSPTMLQKEAG